MKRLTKWFPAFLLVLLLAGCDVGSTATTSGTMDAKAMNMGDPTATPAEEVVGTELMSGTFVLLDTRPDGYEEVSGTAALARYDAGTTVTVRMENLITGVSYIHVHDGTRVDYGGNHFKFDPAGFGPAAQ